MHCLAIAFGTRGDVQPLAILIQKMQANALWEKVLFVTHSAHNRFLQSLFLDSHTITVYPVPSPPAVPYRQRAKRKRPRPGSSFSGRAEDPFLSKLQEEECLAAAGLKTGWAAPQHFGPSEWKPGVILFTLFSLEGYHLAEALDVPRCCFHPYFIPTSLPSRFKSSLRREQPYLFRVLQENSDCGKGIGWKEIEHWMWPLFTDRWERFRKMLNLSAVPVVPSQKEPPVLVYLMSPEVVDALPYWPISIQLAGYVLNEPKSEEIGNPCLKEFLRKQDPFGAEVPLPVYVTFGSMPSLEVSPEGAGSMKDLVEMIIEALASLKLRAILHDSSLNQKNTRNVFADSLAKLDEVSRNSFFVLNGNVSHASVLKGCLFAVHHGGSGTTAAVTSAGIPQVIFPCMFDQFFWKERMDWVGVGVPYTGINIESIKSAFQRAMKPFLRLKAACLGRKVRIESEGSVQRCSDAINAACKNFQPRHALALPALKDFPELSEQVLPNGMSVMTMPGSTEEVNFLYEEIFEQRVYLKHGITLEDGDIIFDVGANIGLFSLFISDTAAEAGIKCGVFCFEPVEPIFNCLEENLRRHFFGSYSAHNIGLSNECQTKAKVKYFHHIPGNSCLKTYEAEKEVNEFKALNPVYAEKFASSSECLSCKLTTLENAFKQFDDLKRPIDLLKIDVEGAELDVISGICPADWSEIKQVVAEVHDVGKRLNAFKAALETNGMHILGCQRMRTDLNNMLVYAKRCL